MYGELDNGALSKGEQWLGKFPPAASGRRGLTFTTAMPFCCPMGVKEMMVLLIVTCAEKSWELMKYCQEIVTCLAPG